MLFAMDSLGKSTELLELKFIQRAESCQIHRHGSNLLASLLATSNQKLIAELTAKNRVPSIYVREDYVNSGGLMSYGADRDELFRRGAIYVDKILKAAKPADLPVEQPTKFDW